jgi:Flp pilus assembly protein TadG
MLAILPWLKDRPLASECDGNILIEFALALPIIFLLLAGMLDLGRYGLQKSAMLQGAREGAQYGVIAYSDSANINTTAQNATGLTGVTATNSVFCECVSGTTVACTSTCSGGTSPRRYITVTTTRTFTPMVSSLSFGAFGSWTAPSALSASITLLVP